MLRTCRSSRDILWSNDAALAKKTRFGDARSNSAHAVMEAVKLTRTVAASQVKAILNLSRKLCDFYILAIGSENGRLFIFWGLSHSRGQSLPFLVVVA